MTCGGTISGNCARGRPRRETSPTITAMMAMTIATIGRSMKNLTTRLAFGLPERPRRHDASLPDRYWRADDHRLAGGHPGFDDLENPDAIANGDRANRDVVARAEDLDLIPAL